MFKSVQIGHLTPKTYLTSKNSDILVAPYPTRYLKEQALGSGVWGLGFSMMIPAVPIGDLLTDDPPSKPSTRKTCSPP